MAVKPKSEVEQAVRECAERMCQVRDAARRASVKQQIVDVDPPKRPQDTPGRPGPLFGQGKGQDAP